MEGLDKDIAHLYTIVKVARDEDLVRQIGRHIYFDLVDYDKVFSFCIKKQTLFSVFKEEVAKEFGIPVKFQRFWLSEKWEDYTSRRPMTALEEALSVGHLSNKAGLKLFLEVEFGLDLRLIPPPEKSEEDIMLFFKLYDPEKGELRYVGRIFVKSFGRPIDILEKLNQMAGFAPDEEIELYEEITFELSNMCDPVDKGFTFQASEIQDGDIICFQKAPPVESEEECLYPDVPSFWEYINNRQIVHFRSLEKPKEDNFCAELSKLNSYDEVVERVARRIGLDDPSKIRLTSHDCHSQQPKPQPIKYRGVENLSKMLVHDYQISDILYYEVLNIPLPELRSFKDLKVAVHHTTKDEVVIHNIRLPKHSTVGDVINELKTKEIKFEPSVMCEPVDKRVSFLASQLEDGDIICFQKAPPLESEEECRYPDLPSFLEFIHNRQIVHFRSLEKPEEDNFWLELSKLHSYDEVVERVACRIGVDDPSKIRLTSHNCYSQQPKPQPIRYRGVENLSDMLVHYNQMSDILYYEVLDIPLPVLQSLKNLKIAFHHAIKDEVVIHNIRLPKHSTVGDLINELKTKVELSHPNAELRLLEIFYHKIYKIFPPSEKIENINDQYWTLRAEEIPEEEKNLSPQYRLIHVYHFTKESAQNQMQVQNFGEPFFLVIHKGETLAEVKERIQKKLQVHDEEFSKWKFAFFSLGQPEYLQDSDIVFTHFQRRDVYGIWEQYLGLEHSMM